MKDKEQSKADDHKLMDEIWDKAYPKCSTLREAWRMAMQEYSQFKSQQSVITDREIEEVFEYYHPAIDEDERRICLKVAKWAIEKQRTDDRELLNTFIKEIKDEFKDENWDYLDFIADRVLNGK